MDLIVVELLFLLLTVNPNERTLEGKVLVESPEIRNLGQITSGQILGQVSAFRNSDANFFQKIEKILVFLESSSDDSIFGVITSDFVNR